MKRNINTILPIILAVILPGLGLYINPHPKTQYWPIFIRTWVMSSILLYALWNLLLRLADFPNKYNVIKGAVGVIFLFGVVFMVNSNMDAGHIENGIRIPIIRLILIAILFLSIQHTLKTQENMAKLLVEREQAQTENYKAQLKALRAQVDPHFLFNSLNTLRSMVRQHHQNSEKFILCLSDFYRQTLKHNENTTLPLHQELEVLESFLFLMKSRNEKAVIFELNVDEALMQQHLPTLALQLVVENCFKHNSMTSKKPLHIKIYNLDNTIVVSNNKQPKLGIKSSGLGLDLLRKRYELMAVEQGVAIEEDSIDYKAVLKLIHK